MFSNQNIEVRNILTIKLSSITPGYIKACRDGKLKCPEDISYNFGNILSEFVKLGVKKPNELCLQEIIEVSQKVLNSDPRRYDNILEYLLHLDKIIFTFLTWSFDPNQFNNHFWSTWFERIINCYPSTKESRGGFNAMILSNLLLSALRFDQLNELIKFKSFWIDSYVGQQRYHPPFDVLSKLIVEVTQKLNNKPEPRVENALKEILAV